MKHKQILTRRRIGQFRIKTSHFKLLVISIAIFPLLAPDLFTVQFARRAYNNHVRAYPCVRLYYLRKFYANSGGIKKYEVGVMHGRGCALGKCAD